MCRLLGSAGHQTTVVSDGMAVLEFAASSAPDIIVMKQGLPMMKGSSVAPLISAMPRTRNVPVLVYSEDPPDNMLSGRGDGAAPRGILKWVVTKEAGDIVDALSEALAVPA
jgi:CheY-like chemotaxis protein